MADDNIITVTVNAKGTGLSIDMEGFHGVGCKDLARAFDVMGPSIREEEKPEIYDNNSQNVLRQGR